MNSAMDKSFELLSTMSPKIRGRQKTCKVKSSSRLALKKYFRRSSIFDKSIGIRSKDLSIVDVPSSSSGSIFSSQDVEPHDKNEIAFIESSDSEDNVQGILPEVKLKRFPNCSSEIEKNQMVKNWLENVEDRPGNPSFFSQVSTVCGDSTANINKEGNRIAASSSFNDCLTHRFDELFIDKEKDSKNVDKADAHDDSVNKELNTDLKRHSEEAKVTNTSDEDNVGTSLEPSSEYKTAGDEPFPTNDESIIIVTPVKSVKSLSPVNKCQDFITVRRKREEKKTLDCPATPTDQNIESQMKVMLDSIYGKSWRAHQQKVFLPMSERKVKRSDNIPIVAPITERIIKPPFKNTLLPNKKLTHTKLNFDSLKKPVKSPWISKLKGLVDSDSADEGNNTKDIKKVKSRLNFGDKTPTKKSVKSNHYEENTANVKHLLKECNIKANIPAKANLQKQYYYQNIEKGANTIGKRRTESSSSITTDEEYDKEIEILELTRNKTVREKNKKYSFLESLSATVPLNQCDMSARLFRTNFKQHKQELAKRLFSLFNENVFDDAIPGNCAIEWNTKLTKTAGLCHFKKITHRQGQIERQVKISLSTKVLDSPCRLRDTLIHEMCHAASFIVNRITDGHGPYWKSWAFKAMEKFPELPPIRRCHDYRINSKYTYKCTGCHYSFGRHTKSLDLDRKRCGYCMGRFEVFLNKKGKSGSTKAVPIAERKEVTGFALFVKENYAKYKEPSKTHRDIMTMLSQKFAELKVISTK
ncbi:uncharacterized protein LOC109538489 [Dendroctonus ponderosae]|uniref:uncharacterized protein LOC109538489 n=1 Tax=Dendroctonus ponderosae TaxID=77166 RepID=UPI00203651FA|nr:uncharacterized protein LOC109538489 [Dendroctonus ponderosae]